MASSKAADLACRPARKDDPSILINLYIGRAAERIAKDGDFASVVTLMVMLGRDGAAEQ